MKVQVAQTKRLLSELFASRFDEPPPDCSAGVSKSNTQRDENLNVDIY